MILYGFVSKNNVVLFGCQCFDRCFRRRIGVEILQLINSEKIGNVSVAIRWSRGGFAERAVRKSPVPVPEKNPSGAPSGPG